MQLVLAGRAAPGVGVDPAERHTGVVGDQHPARPGRDLVAQPDGRLRARVDGGVGEAEGPVAAVLADETRHELVGGLGEQVGGAGELRQVTALAHHGHRVPERERLVDVVGDEDDGDAEVALEATHLLLEVGAHEGVDGAERLVHQDHVGAAGQRAGHADPLLLPPGELGGVAPRLVGGEPHLLDRLHRGGAGPRPVPAEQARDGHHVGQDRAVREETGVLDDVTDRTAQLGRRPGGDVLTVEGDAALGGLDHPVDHAQRGGLPAAGRADEHGDAAAGDVEGQGVHGHRAVGVALGDAVEPDHPDHPRGTTASVIGCTAARRVKGDDTPAGSGLQGSPALPRSARPGESSASNGKAASSSTIPARR